MENDLFKVLMDIKESVGGLHAKVDAFSDDIEDHKKDDDIAHMRITSLEQTRSRFHGGYAVLVVSVSVASVLLTLLVSSWSGR